MMPTLTAIIAIVSLLPNENLISTQVLDESNWPKIQRRAKAAEINNYIDASVDPCQNFYNYACGKWAKINPAIKVTKTGFVSVLKENYERKLKKILNSPKNSTTESSTERKVKRFYKSCVHEFEQPHDNRQKFIDLMDEFGGMPALKAQNWRADEFNWLNVTAEILRKYNKQILVSVYILPDFRNKNRTRLYVGFPRKQHFEHVTFDELKLKIEGDLEHILGIGRATAIETAAEIAKFQFSLNEVVNKTFREMQPQQNWPLRLINDMSVEYGPHLDLKQFMRNWLGHDYLLPVYEPTNTFHENLKLLVQVTPKPVLANFIMWHLIKDFYIDLEPTLTRQQRKCLILTASKFSRFLNFKLYQQMTESYAALTNDTMEIWQELRTTFMELLSKSKVRPSCKEKLMNKLEGMSLEILNNECDDFEAEYVELTISSENLFENLLNINAYLGFEFQRSLFNSSKLHIDIFNISPSYLPDQNKIRLPAAFLAPHYRWNPAYPATLKYTTIGHAIAHEMAHGFEDTGSKFDANGKLVSNYDQQLTGKLFSEVLLCLYDHYQSFHFVQYDQAENFADHMAMKITFETYMKLFRLEENLNVWNEQHLVDFGLPPKKLFFVATAQFWCAAFSEDFDIIPLPDDNHAPEEVRVNAMMSSMPEFANEFNCKINSTMNPANKCAIF